MDKILFEKPFNLNDDQANWVKETFSKMDDKAKIGQLFILVAGMNPQEDIAKTIETYQPGGFMYRPLPKDKIFKMHQLIQQNSKIPAFLAANTEAGGDGIATEGTHVGSNMQVGATNDAHYAYSQGEIAGKELRAVGGNLSFAPVSDINFEWRNPITNVRSYGDDPKKVHDFVLKNIEGMQKQGAAASIKHFPGDGIDSRDHHVVGAMNHLNLKEWDKTYGSIYQDAFKNGVLATMVGHFLAPQLVKDLGGKEEDIYHPSSSNKTLLKKLLRDHLGFNGLVITDSTLMVGMIKYPYTREELIPMMIENGIDVFLFVRNMEEDYQSMFNGYKKGILSRNRLDEAVIRILATKAKLNLFNDLHLDEANLALIGKEEHQKIAKEVAQKSITLIKNEYNLLPFKENIKSVLLVSFLKPGFFDKPDSDPKALSLILNKFKEADIKVDVRDYNRSGLIQGIMDTPIPIKTLKDKYDAVLYFSDQQSSSNTSSLTIQWKAASAQDAPWLISEIPSAWISLGSPYHLFDAPQVPHFINAYHNNEMTINALFDCLLGKKDFEGISPVNHNVAYINDPQ